MSPEPTFEFDEEQEFFVDLQGLEMYHTDVVEALNNLLVLVHEIRMQATRKNRAASDRSLLLHDLDKIVSLIDALPENLK